MKEYKGIKGLKRILLMGHFRQREEAHDVVCTFILSFSNQKHDTVHCLQL